MTEESLTAIDRRTRLEADADARLYELFQEALHRLPPDQLLRNLGLFIDRIAWGDYLFMVELYRMSMEVHGVVAEFGVRWGKNLALFSALRGVLEPFNHTRRIIGFDTFTGLSGSSEQDGVSPSVKQGQFSTGEDYEVLLNGILTAQEAKSPVAQIRKFELVKGDVRETLDAYLKRHPETIFSLVYFDMDIYEPTRYCLERIKTHLTKGTIIGFDEVCNPKFPGETVALAEKIGLATYPIRRTPYSANGCFLQIA